MHLSPWEIILIVALAFLIFGPKRLPELARSLGEGIREFKKSLSATPEEKPPTPIEPPAATENATKPAEKG